MVRCTMLWDTTPDMGRRAPYGPARSGGGVNRVAV